MAYDSLNDALNAVQRLRGALDRETYRADALARALSEVRAMVDAWEEPERIKARIDAALGSNG